ncbi:MAG: endo-1,4-beta-xylanase [Cyclobacteriaceae bacterium]
MASLFSCGQEKPTEQKTPPTLRSSFSTSFEIGAALGKAQIDKTNEKESALIKREFSSLTPENCMKWERIHPQPDSFNFKLADDLVALAQSNGQQMIGHTLIWHSQVPDWVFLDDQGEMVDTTVLYARMKDHINQVAGRYKGKIHGWDVVNEALNGDGTLRNSKYYQIAGEEFIHKAFQYANEVDPNMELYYNDYSMNQAAKVEGAVELAKRIKARGLRIDGIGMQGHWGINGPSIEEIEASILKVANAGLKVMITELDIDVLPNPRNIQGANISDSFETNKEANPYVDGLPDSINEVHAQRYQDLFELFYKHRDKISRVTFWGVHDGQSWKNNWPARGRTNYCLVFDREFDPKLAYNKIIDIPETE